MQVHDSSVIELINKLQAWHKSRVDNLKMVVEHKGADLHIGETLIAGDSDIAKGIRFGVAMALEKLGTLPFTVTPVADREDEGDEE